MKKVLFAGAFIGSALILAVGPVRAGSDSSQPHKQSLEPADPQASSLLKKLWAVPVLYEDPENPWIQKIALKGRYHGHYYALDSNHGDASDWENRRVRLGFAVDFLKKFDLSTEFNLNIEEGGDRFIQNLEELRLRYKPSKSLTVSAGRIKAPISYEWRQSSNEFDYIERSLIINQAVHGRLWGVLGEWKVDSWRFGTGVYNAHEDGDWNLPRFDGGALFYAGIGYEIEKGHVVQLDAGFLTEDDHNNATRPYEQLWSLWYAGEFGRTRLAAETLFAVGEGTTPDAWGIIVTPTYDLVPKKLRAVLRYQFADGAQDALTLQRRYEREAPDLPTSSASDYHAVYAGLTYYIHGDKLKIQAGAEFAHAELAAGGSYESVTGLLAVRVSF